jgi:pilus assembly protein CpaF
VSAWQGTAAPSPRRGDLLDRVRSELAARSGARAAPTDVVGALAGAGSPLAPAGLLLAAGDVHASLVGAGALQPLLEEPGVTDVLVNGPHQVWVDRGDGLVRVPVDVGDEAALRALAVRLAAAAGRRLDDASPFVDARLDGGVRLHAVLPPLSPAGTLVSLRVPARRAFTLDGLVAAGTVPPAWAPVLDAVVRARVSFLVSGGTGSGKTTVLGALLSRADPAERVVLVEDAGELLPLLPHVVRLEARHPNLEGAGGVGLDVLVRQALRMRPDRVVVGECRGAEVRDLLAALNTGHEGGCGTVHANTAGDVPARLAALGVLAGLGADALAAQAASAVHAVLHLARRGGCRRLVEVAALGRAPDGSLVARTALGAGAQPDDPGTAGPAWPDLAARLDLPPRWPPVPGDGPRAVAAGAPP